MAVDLNRFQKNLVYRRTATIESLLVDINKIAKTAKTGKTVNLDKTGTIVDEKPWYFKVLLAIAIGAISAALLLLSLPLALVFFVKLLPLVLIGTVIYYACPHLSKLGADQNQVYGEVKVPYYRYLTLKKVLYLLRRDLEEDANVDVRLAIDPVIDKRKCYQSDRRQDWQIDCFWDDWLMIQGQFIDGTQFVLSGAEIAVAQYGLKRSRSGKKKYKMKAKGKGLEIGLSLSFPRRKYGAISLLKHEAAAAIKLPDLVQLKTFQMKGNRMYLRVKTPSESAPSKTNIDSLYATIVMMFLSLYQILNLARVLSKKTAA